MSKKTVEQIVEQQQHYLIALKANQPSLLEALEQLHQSASCESEAYTFDHSHKRGIHRRLRVYLAPPELQQQWAGLQCLIWVNRWGNRDGKPFHETIGYISDLMLDAEEFLVRVQHHWSIENRLHWVRDVTFDEDYSHPGGNAPVIWAILNCFLITLVRQLGYRTLPQGIRLLANQFKKVFSFLTQGFSSG